MPKKKTLYVNLSLDVEEEGLFSGYYKARDPGVKNVSLLPALAPITREFGVPLTLYCSWAIFNDAAARNVLTKMSDELGAEIGAHLHHWSTPPFLDDPENRTPARTDKLPGEILEKKLDALLAAGEAFRGSPITSFRMGRWDLKRALLAPLAERGIKADSSVCPLRVFPDDGPDFFLAPADPWRVPLPDGRSMLEIPVTQIPLWRPLARLWNRAPVRDSFHFFGAISPNPFWHSPFINRLAAKLHASRGGRVLSLFWHSSEMMPGGSPATPDKAAADATLKRIFAYFRWLNENFDVRGVTAAQLAELASGFPLLPPSSRGDW